MASEKRIQSLIKKLAAAREEILQAAERRQHSMDETLEEMAAKGHRTLSALQGLTRTLTVRASMSPGRNHRAQGVSDHTRPTSGGI